MFSGNAFLKHLPNKRQVARGQASEVSVEIFFPGNYVVVAHRLQPIGFLAFQFS